MGDEKLTEMKPEEAIIEIRSLQLKHNQEIKQLKEEFKSIQENITMNINDTNKNMEEKLDALNDKISAHVATTSTKIDNGLSNIKEEMATTIIQQMKSQQDEARTHQEQNSNSLAAVIRELRQEIKGIKHGIANSNNGKQDDDNTPRSDNNEIPLASQQLLHERNIPSPTTNSETASIHTNPIECNSQKMQTILLPAPTAAPAFHGKATERPWQFLIRIEDYAETVLMWGEDTLLRGISQFLKDTALEWHCQLRSCHSLPRTWSDFKQAFMRQFNSPLRKAQQKQQWKECKQGNEETINEFVIRLRALWVEQYPLETESDLIKHLLCKIRPEMLSVIGCPRNASLQEILLEAQRVEEILYHRTKSYSHDNIRSNRMQYDNDNNNTIQDLNLINKKNIRFQMDTPAHSNNRNSMTFQQTQRDQTNRQQLTCYTCGRLNHKARDCWYNKRNNSNFPYKTTSFTKNE